MMLLRSDNVLSLLSFDFCFYRHISSSFVTNLFLVLVFLVSQ